jgi:hypothetical protein
MRRSDFSEVIIYLTVGLKPHNQVKDEMARFMAEVAAACEGAHHSALPGATKLEFGDTFATQPGKFPSCHILGIQRAMVSQYQEECGSRHQAEGTLFKRVSFIAGGGLWCSGRRETDLLHRLVTPATRRAT